MNWKPPPLKRFAMAVCNYVPQFSDFAFKVPLPVLSVMIPCNDGRLLEAPNKTDETTSDGFPRRSPLAPRAFSQKLLSLKTPTKKADEGCTSNRELKLYLKKMLTVLGDFFHSLHSFVRAKTVHSIEKTKTKRNENQSEEKRRRVNSPWNPVAFLNCMQYWISQVSSTRKSTGVENPS